MKKGFTLIELLAVIVILAIIALIATPIVLNIINDSKDSAQLRSAEMYLKGVETSVASAIIYEKNVMDGKHPIMPEGDVCLGTLQVSNETTTCNGEVLEVEMNGETPTSGTVTIASGKITNLSFTYSNGKTIVKNDEKLVYSDEKNETGKVEYTAYSIGDEVTIGTENFYVLKDSDETNPNVTLLAKDCINTSSLVQSVDADLPAFSSESYWGSGTSPYDIVEPKATLDETTGKLTLPASHKAAKAAYDYGRDLGGTGRLMTYSEATALQTANSDILYGRNGKSSSTFLDYWLGSASDADVVRFVRGTNSILVAVNFRLTNSNGVRPVVEISKDKIS